MPASATLADADSAWRLHVLRLRALAERALAAAPGAPRLVRLSVPVEPVDPLAWLAAQDFSERFYWRGRGASSVWAAVGQADVVGTVEPLETLEQRVRLLQPEERLARYFGGVRFGPEHRPADEWQAFGSWRFVLPRYELETLDGRSTLTLNLLLPRDAATGLRELTRGLRPPRPLHAAIPPPGSRHRQAELPGWRKAVDAVLADIERGEVDKVVLARRVRFAFEQALDPVALLGRLRVLVPEAFHFLVQPGEQTAFVGASPERLLHWRRGTLKTEALAGTRPRHPDPRRDADLRRELAASGKDQREHRHVVEHLLAALEGTATELRVEQTGVMDLPSSRHLWTPIEVAQADSTGPLDLLRRLHPTPAVAGRPRHAALERIAALEQFDRGWYAGPVGWVAAEEAEFAVAIRSGLVRLDGDASTLDLFSGAGIVAGSDPDSEWDELEHKIADFVQVLGLDQR